MSTNAPTSPRPLAGRVAVITGASSGIGSATAEALAADGAAVALLARRGDRIDALATRIEQSGAGALAIATDVTDADAVERAGARSAPSSPTSSRPRPTAGRLT